jgi:hypothetical protein
LIDVGEYPTQWVEGLSVPVPKGGNKQDPNNYRRITVVPVLGKLFEVLFNRRLVFLKDALFKGGDKFNGGFKKNSTTSDNMFILHGAIQRSQFLRKPLYVAFVDFRRAFDTVNRNMMFYKLMKKKIDGKLIRLLHDMYSKTKSKICINGYLSEFLYDTLGVNQGGANSPDMFVDFLSDMSEYLTQSCGIVVSTELLLMHLLWADDLILVSDSVSGLQKQLDNLYNFCCDWQLIVNTVKTKFMVFGTKKDDAEFYFNEMKLERVEKYKYVGTIFSSNGPLFNENVLSLITSATRAVHKVRAYCKSMGQIPPVTAMKLYNSLVAPILSYGCEIWFPVISQNLKDTVDKFKLKFMKSALRVKQQTSTTGVLGELAEYPVSTSMNTKTVKYWLRIRQLPGSSIVKQMYACLVSLHNMGHNTWVTGLKSILQKSELAHLWDIDIENVQQTAQGIRKHNELVFRSIWTQEVNDCIKNPKLRLYKEIKESFDVEPYLYINVEKYRVALSRLRLSSHHLGIEVGRHARPIIPADQRFCTTCTDKIDDEIHFLIECQKYQGLRSKMFTSLNSLMPTFPNLSNKEKFVNLMNTDNVEILVHVGKFVHCAWKKE